MLSLALCGTAPANAAAERPVPITLTTATAADLAVWEASVGQIEALEAPQVAAEVAGRVIALDVDVGDPVRRGQLLARIDPQDYRLAVRLAEADIERIEALMRAQTLTVERLRKLVASQSSNRSALDEAEAQLGALKAQSTAARVRLSQAQRALDRTELRSPIDGRVDERRVSVGDYVKAGTGVLHLVAVDRLRARLPFPETLAGRLKIGLPVRLRLAGQAGRRINATVSELRPRVRRNNRALEVIVQFDNPGGWEPGASVTGEVRVALYRQAVQVPEAAVVRRPAGEVVYRVVDGTARAQPVVTGLRRAGRVQIRDGVAAGESLVLDGAGFLSDGAPVEVRRP